MSQETIFQSGDYTYSVVDFYKRTCRLGNNSNIAPNAIPIDYSRDVIIPSQVWYQNKLFYVTEIGQHSLSCLNCTNITRVFIPYTVEVICEWGLARLLNVEEIQFESGSH